jgi:hypothetical protein
MVDEFMRARMDSVPAGLYRQKYPEMKTLDKYYGAPGEAPITGDAFKGIPPEGNMIVRNVCFGNWSDITWHADSALFEIHDNFVTKERVQYCGQQNGFTIPADSPAWKMGFSPVPFDKMGLQENEIRKSLEVNR